MVLDCNLRQLFWGRGKSRYGGLSSLGFTVGSSDSGFSMGKWHKTIRIVVKESRIQSVLSDFAANSSISDVGGAHPEVFAIYRVLACWHHRGRLRDHATGIRKTFTTTTTTTSSIISTPLDLQGSQKCGFLLIHRQLQKL